MTDAHKTYHMTGRPPVRIKLAEWSSLADVSTSWHDGAVECQAHRTSGGWIEVLQHDEDERVLVVGKVWYTSAWEDEPGQGRSAGVLLTAEQATPAGIVAAIQRLDLCDVPHVDAAALKRHAINDLPPEEL